MSDGTAKDVDSGAGNGQSSSRRQRGQPRNVPRIGAGEKLDRNDPQSKSAAMWLACKVSGKRSCAATAAQVRKGDVVSIDGNLVMGAPWTTQDGETRQDLVLWVDDLRIWGPDAEPVSAPDPDQPIADSDIPF